MQALFSRRHPVYIPPKQRFREHIYSFDPIISNLPGFTELPRGDQSILMRMKIKQLNINPKAPRTGEEFDIVCQTYGQNPAMIGDPIPVSERPDFKITVSTKIVREDGIERIVTRTLQQETTQWLIDNGYCLGPRKINFSITRSLMRRESCDPYKELKMTVRGLATMGIPWAICFVTLRSLEKLRMIPTQGISTWTPPLR